MRRTACWCLQESRRRGSPDNAQRDINMRRDRVAHALANPAQLPFLALSDWTRLLRHAQRSELLARIATLAFGHQLIGRLPQLPRRQLELVQQAVVTQQQQRQLDLQALMRLIEPIGVEVVALQGTAYWLCHIAATNDRISVASEYSRGQELPSTEGRNGNHLQSTGR